MKKLTVTIVGALLLILFVAVIWELIYMKTTAMQEVYILPRNFRGVVLIAYDQKDGLMDIQEDGKLIYRIPPSGILKLRRISPAKLSRAWYYFEDLQGTRTEFYYCSDPKEMQRHTDSIFAFGGSFRGFENKGERVKFEIFFIGSERNRDSLSKFDEKLNPLEAIKYNRIKAID